jgi:hypothetical protein
MTQFTKTHSDLQPVFHVDSAAYTTGALNALTSAVVVNLAGPKLDFYTVTATGAFTGAQAKTIIDTLQQLATVYMYQYVDASNDTLAVAVYPYGAWGASAIDTALTAAGVTGTTTSTGASFTAGA